MNSPWFRFPRVLWVACLLAVLLTVPGFWMGAFGDDYFHQMVLEQLTPFGGPLNLYQFSSGDPAEMRDRLCHGPYPWWTLPEIRVVFCRPLSSALLWADQQLFGRNLTGAHLHSALWYAALTLVCGLLYRRILPGGVAALALLLFVLNQSHWFPAVWPANRNALVAAVPALAGMLAYMRWREEGWTWGLPLSLLGLVVGFLGSETAVGVLGLWGFYAVLGPREPFARRVVAFLPVLAVTAGYLAVYKALGYGAHGSGSYIDPVGEPLAYAAALPARLLALAGGVLLSAPVDLWVLWLSLRPLLSFTGLAALLLFAGLLWRCWPALEEGQRRALRWIMPGTALSLLPVAATFPMNRLLLVPSIGGSVIVATVLAHYWPRWRDFSGMRRRLAGTLVLLLAVVNFGVSPVLWVAASAAVTVLDRRVEAAYAATPLVYSEDSSAHNVLLVAPDPLACAYPPIIHALLTGRNELAPWTCLSLAPHDHRLTRTADNALTLEVVDGCMFRTEFEQLMRTPSRPLRKGDRVELCGMEIAVLEESGGGPTKIGLTVDRSLDDPALNFLVWKDRGMHRFSMPRVGESVVVARGKGLMG